MAPQQSGKVALQSDGETQLAELARLEVELSKLITTTQVELRRQEQEVSNLNALVGRQRETLYNLLSPKTKVVSLREYKTIRLALNLNDKNIATAQMLVREAKRALAKHEENLKAVRAAHAKLDKELKSQGTVLLFPAKGAHRGRSRKTR